MKRLLKLAAACFVILLLALVLFVCVMALFNGRTGSNTDHASSPLAQHPPSPLAAPITLRVVTFNVQDLPLVSRYRPERMRAIGAKLMLLDPDIVGFQEAFVAADREILIEELSMTRLAHFVYYPSGTSGSGLLIASAFPLKETYFHRYTVSNPWYKLWEGDWWAGKGVALARIALPDSQGYLDFYNTHAQAGYGNPAYALLRTTQMSELAAFVNETRTGTSPALVVGDFNCRIGQADYAAAVEGAGLVRLMDLESRIDHIFGVMDAAYTMETVATTKIAEHLKLNNKEFDLSDHVGYLSEIRISPNPPQ